MMIDNTIYEDVVILHLKGRMDLERIKDTQQLFQEYLDQGHRKFVMNMIDVSDISSSGISTLLSMLRQLESLDGHMVLAEMSAVSEYVLDLAGLSEEFECYHQTNQALDSFLRPELPNRLRHV